MLQAVSYYRSGTYIAACVLVLLTCECLNSHLTRTSTFLRSAYIPQMETEQIHGTPYTARQCEPDSEIQQKHVFFYATTPLDNGRCGHRRAEHSQMAGHAERGIK